MINTPRKILSVTLTYFVVSFVYRSLMGADFDMNLIREAGTLAILFTFVFVPTYNYTQKRKAKKAKEK